MTRLQKSLSAIGLMFFVFYILTHIEFHRTTKHNISDVHVKHEDPSLNKQDDIIQPKQEKKLHVIEKVFFLFSCKVESKNNSFSYSMLLLYPAYSLKTFWVILEKLGEIK